MSTDDLDQIARLFRLRESGALTQAEFEAEKARVLSARDADDRAAAGEASPREPVEAAAYSEAEHHYANPHEGERYRRSKWPLALVVLAAILALGAGVGWYATRGSSTTAERAATGNAASASKVRNVFDMPVAPEPASTTVAPPPGGATPTPAPTEAAYPKSEWFVLDQGADFSASFGPPEAESSYSLECDAPKRSISFISWGADASSGNTVVVEVAGASPYAADVAFSSDGMGSGTVVIPADNGLYTELINGNSPLRVKWNKGSIDEMPNAPKLQNFLKLCRQRSGL